jgi:sugar lactone lactonase YvrE
MFGILLAVGLAGGMSRAATLGDVDGDGRVTVQDAVRMAKIVALNGAPSSREMLFGDVSPSSGPLKYLPSLWTFGDGQISPDDVADLLRFALGLKEKNEIGPVVVTVAGSGPQSHLIPNRVAADDPLLVKDGRASEIYLFDPWDLAISPTGDIYFTEYIGNRVRVLQKDGTIRTLAGSLERGFVDGPGDIARFYHPMGLAFLPDGSLVVSDTLNHSIRKITPEGVVTTLAGNGRPGYADGVGTEARFRGPNGIATDSSGNVYVADTDNYRICKIDPSGRVTTAAGARQAGANDGPAEEARFYLPSGVCYDPRDQGVFITDMANNLIRKLTAEAQVITVAGNGGVGHVDGDAQEAQFNYPYGCDLDSMGQLWIADWYNESVRVLTPEGRVRTAAGRLPAFYTDGPASRAKFKGLMNVRIAPNGIVYLADTDNERIRALVP